MNLDNSMNAINPLLINTFDNVGGAARAAYRLHHGLLEHGIKSRYFVSQKSSDDPTVLGPSTNLEKVAAKLRYQIEGLPLFIYRDRQNVIFSPAWVPWNFHNFINRTDADIIHLHWINGGFLQVETFKKIKKPIIWTLHDSWAFTGGCHMPLDCKKYETACGCCPVLKSNKTKDISYRIFLRKQRSWKDLPLTIVTPSRWLADKARSSALFNGRRIEVIPNGIDTHRYKPMEKKIARELLSLPQNKKIILFGTMNAFTDLRKGIHHLQKAILILSERYHQKEDVEIVVFGASKPAGEQPFSLKTYYMDRLYDDISLSLLYASADVFVAPSIEENLPYTIMESLSCGTPCVAFKIGGIPDLIEHKGNGYLAAPLDPKDLAQGIYWVLEDEKRHERLSSRAREKVIEEFDIKLISRKYMEMYYECKNTAK